MSTEETKQKPMTDEERLALCQKLDSELDEFIEGLERKRYTEGWPEDRWQEEMDKHPFFMKQTPENGEMSPLAEGLARLKYDPDENTQLDLAQNYKEDGNFNFKHKNYRLAIIGYTEGIKQKCDDAETQASLYNNRAAAHYELKNFRSSLFDSEKALTFNPKHVKASIRAAKCALNIKKYDLCIEKCNDFLKTEPNSKEMLDILNKAKQSKLVFERDLRKRDRTVRKKEEDVEKILNTIKARGIKISNQKDEDDLDWSKLEPNLPGAQDSVVYLGENDILNWPILILYPEFGTTDFIRNCPENVPLKNQIEQLFPAPWDEDKKYSCSTVNVYYEGVDKKPHLVDFELNLVDILVQKSFLLKAGTPAFFVVVRRSKVEKKFLDSYK